MAKIEIDAYDSEEVLKETTPEESTGTPRKKNKRRAAKARRRVARILIFLLSAGCVAGAYPLGKQLFDKTMDSDAEVEVIPRFLLDLIPSGVFSSLFDKVGGAVGISDSNNQEEETQEEETIDIDDPNVLTETTPVADAYMAATIFIGDERLQGFVDENLIEQSQVFAETGMRPGDVLEKEFEDSTTNLTGTLETILPAREPEHIYLLMGLSGLDEDEYLDDYKTLVQTLKEKFPNTSIVVCSLLPVNEETAHGAGLSDAITNDKIDSMNTSLLVMCRDTGAYFLNAYSKIATSGSLDENYDKGDGISLSSDGYDAWLSYIQKHAVPSN